MHVRKWSPTLNGFFIDSGHCRKQEDAKHHLQCTYRIVMSDPEAYKNDLATDVTRWNTGGCA
jgi:hypothetical protein